MNIDEILKKIDDLLKDSKHDEAEKYMKTTLSKAEDEKNWQVQLTLLNEIAGFYRDMGKMNKAIEACLSSEKIMDDNNVGKTKERAAAYLNTANAYRAAGDLDESFSAYKRAFDIIQVAGDPSLYSSYYNNLALLHQEAGKFSEAVNCLKKALSITIEKMNDPVREAISRTNLATSLIRMKQLEEAREYLMPAIDIFRGRIPSDFHYSAALSAMGDLSLLSGDIKNSANYFEAALSEIELHMGRNNFFKIVTDNLNKVYEIMGGKPSLTGIELSQKYFDTFARPAIDKNFSHLKKHIAAGMFGEGSECIGFDDEISKDHDYGSAFVLVTDDQISDEDFNALSNMYNGLPKTFMGIHRLNTAEGAGRTGVIRITDILKKSTGFDHIPKGNEEWKYTLDENLNLIVNGKIFMDDDGWFTDIRKHISTDQPYFVYFNKLAMNLELMAKHGQYGYRRASERNDIVAALNSKTEFIKATLRAGHLLFNEYAPYEKWLYKSFERLVNSSKRKGFAAAFKPTLTLITNIASRAINPENYSDDISDMEEICKVFNNLLISSGLSSNTEEYLAVKAHEIKALAAKTVIADSIVDLEWMMFDKTQNEGGRASCQDNWGTFSIMRRSQYYNWPVSLLQLLYADMTEALSNGRNMISEKYGYMMESTSPNEYERIKTQLPALDSDKISIINAIVQIQVQWMEEFAGNYPGLAENARTIHSNQDNPFNTSYETYLRGELSTYHPDTLSAYGEFIVNTANNKQNLAYKIMNMTCFFYGYSSLEDAI